MKYSFQVTYQASIEWLSKEGYLVRIVESIKQVFPYNVAELNALTPFTHYIIGVSVLTSRGAGSVVAIIADTSPTTEGEYSTTFYCNCTCIIIQLG